MTDQKDRDLDTALETTCNALKTASNLQTLLYATNVLLWGTVMSNGGMVILDPEIITRARMNSQNLITRSSSNGGIEITAIEDMGQRVQ